MAANYFDEHNCEPLANGQEPNHTMHIARLLFDTGVWHDVGGSKLVLFNMTNSGLYFT